MDLSSARLKRIARRIRLLELRRDPAVVLRDRMLTGAVSEDEAVAVAEIVRDWLREVGEQSDVETQEAVAGAFERLWQPPRQPVGEPMPAVRDAITTQANRLYYHVSRRTWKDTFYRGVQLYKCPTDMWVYQELIHDLRPGLVIETGTYRGGSALFIADRLEENGHGEVLTVDVTVMPDQPQHDRLSYLVGSSTSEDTLEEVKRHLPRDGSPVLVILDSDHSESHVADELALYAPLVTHGSYLIVEDTNVNGHPVAPEHGPGPWEATQRFLATHPEFEVDLRGERYYLTQNPSGYLRKVEEAPAKDREIVRPARRPRGTLEVAVAALDDVRIDAERPSVVLVLPGLQPGQMFAGVRTAVVSGGLAAQATRRPLHVVTVDDAEVDLEALSSEIADVLRSESLEDVADGLTVGAHGSRDPSRHVDDIWMVTFWTTAVAVKRLVDRGVVDLRRVIYLIQDFEPAFHPWGHEFVLARSTYDFGFAPLVNSSSLATFLEAQGVGAVDSSVVFRPSIERQPLVGAALAWVPDPDVLRVLFYARPSKPRNLFKVGVEGIRAWLEERESVQRVELTLAGESISVPPFLGGGVDVEVAGKLTFGEYYERLGRTDMGLALMSSPHPSHLALELPMAGVPTVTNEFMGSRSAWVEGLQVAAPTVRGISAALAAAEHRANALEQHTPRDLGSSLGLPLAEAVENRVRALGLE